jgi:FkbM family methyltransferase
MTIGDSPGAPDRVTNDSSNPPFRAQFGEDRILARYFADRRSGFYVEVGAHDGVHLSNSYYFEQIGWRGVLVEPDPEMARLCERNRPRSIVVTYAAVGPGSPAQVPFEVAADLRDHSSLALSEQQGQRIQTIVGRLSLQRIVVPALTLDEILDRCSAPEVDFLTIDVEGHELAVLEGITLDRWKPTIVIIERNTELPSRAILRRMRKEGYSYLRTTAGFTAFKEGANGANDWFVRKEGDHALGRWYRIVVALYLPRLIGFVGRRVKRASRRILAPLRPR